jgi:hypothetical protein
MGLETKTLLLSNKDLSNIHNKSSKLKHQAILLLFKKLPRISGELSIVIASYLSLREYANIKTTCISFDRGLRQERGYMKTLFIAAIKLILKTSLRLRPTLVKSNHQFLLHNY